jgi:hypothetical protein
LRRKELGADLPLSARAMTFAPFASAVLAAGLLAAEAGMVGQERPAPSSPGLVPLEELAVPADSVLGLELETLATTRPEDGDDRVAARVTRDVMVGGQVAVPTGSRALGRATLVEKGPKGKEEARLDIRFDTLELPGGERVDIETEPVVREAGGRVPSLTRLGGGAAGGAVVGALLGGGKGAAIGGVLGAAGAAATATDRSDLIELRPGTVLSVRTKGAFKVRVRQ